MLFGSPPCQSWQIVKFHVVNAASTYNAIIGRTTLGALKAIISSPHLKIKFPTEFGVSEVYGDQKISRKCYIGSAFPRKSNDSETSVNQVVDVDPRDIIELDANEPLKTVKIGTKLSQQIRESLVDLLQEFKDIFAWVPKDMPGIPAEIALHCLNIKPGSHPVKQKRRIFSKEKQEAIEKEGQPFNIQWTQYSLLKFGRNIKVYVDDIITMSPISSTHLQDLREIFERARAHEFPFATDLVSRNLSVLKDCSSILSTCVNIVTMQARVIHPDLICKDKFLLQCTMVVAGTTEEDITSAMFAKDGKYVEEKKLRVILVSPPNSPILSPVNDRLKQVQSNEVLIVEDQNPNSIENFSPRQTVIEDVKETKLDVAVELKPTMKKTLRS
ncbi:hypothetical protein AgCh_016488 [Apium graveolens]